MADIKHEGKLDRDQFAVAMHLINEKLAGREIPSVLPNSLIPPSLRGTAAASQNTAASGSITKDLFDLFDDPPAATPATAAAGASAFPSAAAQPQAPTQAAQAAATSGFNAAAFMPQPPSRKPSAPVSRGMSPAPAAPAPSAFGMGPFGQCSFSWGMNQLLTASSHADVPITCAPERPARRRRERSI